MDATLSAAVPPSGATGGLQDPPWPADPFNYTLLGKVGQGAFASVWRAHCKGGKGVPVPAGEKESDEGNTNGNGGRLCAIKIMDLENVDTNFVDIRLEVQTMRLSSHPNVLACHTSFIQETNLWLVMQLMDKGSSLNCIQSARIRHSRETNAYHRYTSSDDEEDLSLEELNARDDYNLQQRRYAEVDLDLERHITYILHETILGLKYIHDNGQIHRDIKGGNILLDGEGTVRIADFGVSGWLVHGGAQRENTRTFVGTPCWMAPEVMEQVHGYDYKADIWSLGITALELAKGYAPYAKYAPMKVLLLTIQEDPPNFETYQDDDAFDEWSETFRSMIDWCLQKDPKQRPSCEELRNHPHFQPFLDPEVRNQYKERIKEHICDRIDDVGKRSKKLRGGGDRERIPSTEDACVDAAAINEKTQNVRNSASAVRRNPVEQNRPPGTSWVFPGMSDDSNDPRNENADFFDEFERTTQGENFVQPSEDTKAEPKDDLNDFMDQLQEITSGENFKRT